MIGVFAPESDQRVISEFFELFKTPWEYLRQDHTYSVVLIVGNTSFRRYTAKLVVHYADCRLAIDAEEGIDLTLRNTREVLSQRGYSLVIYSDHLAFGNTGMANPGGERVVHPLSYRCQRGGVTIERIGYDLFAEISYLLTVGQPEEFARFPTLDLHILLLRELIVESGIELLEIPPVPEGYGCIACLTHDIDHPAIRFHKWDSTAFGFLYRATAGSIAKFIRGRVSFRDLIQNWAAAAKLPFVYMGLAKDFWSGFEDRYGKVEDGIRSTYFVVPFGNHPGIDVSGPAPRRRATGYGAKDIKNSLLKIKANGCEVALHGIDAWCDSELGRRELEELRSVTGDTDLGVRMHWLFYSEKSPATVEQAGASYDSTIGYRTTVGFCNGTTQPYKPLGAANLLELPLHIMDTALFYRAYLGLSQEEAESRVSDVIGAVVKYGGCLTVNWHDRSLTSERHWGLCYLALIEDLKLHDAWFATAGEVAAWFRMRRSVEFETDNSDPDKVRAKVTKIERTNLPGLSLRRHRLDQGAKSGSLLVSHYFDAPLEKQLAAMRP
jgi:hypothetical protein